MIKLRDLFSKDIERDINGVIKAEQVNSDDDRVKQELEEFVVTKELVKHFRKFYTNYTDSLETKTDKIGVWISGFFGSGKSHFLKMLSFLLENREIKGKRAVEYFENKFTDDTIYSDIKRSIQTPTETILFNIDTESSSDGKIKQSGIVDVFLKVFYAKLGYSSLYPRLARIEHQLDKNGKYDRFKQIVIEKTGLTWAEATEGVEFYKDSFVEAYIKIESVSEQTARELFSNVVEEYNITPRDFANLIKDYLDSKGSKNRIIFLVDEIGQFISDNTNLMLNLQTVVENLGSVCQGRAWVIVTSQEAIDSITKERFRDQDFSKIQGRFDTKLSLSGSNTDEVIKRRLLDKTESAKETLAEYYKDQEQILANLITFSSQTVGMKSYQSCEEFIDCYPFVPYQVNLLQNVFSSLRNFSHAGAHLSENERSMLNAFHTALKEYGDKDVKELIPFQVFYSTIQTFIDTNIKRIIEHAKDYDDIEDFDIEVLTVLFMIKYIKDVPSNVENLATLMISNIDDSKSLLSSKIESSLTRLKKSNLIQQNGDEYNFLTNEEQDITRGINSVTIDSSAILNEVYKTVYEDIFVKKSTTLPDGHIFYFTKFIDDINRGHEYPVSIKIITPLNPAYTLSDNDLRQKYTMPNVLFIKLKDNSYLQEIQTILKTDIFIKQKSGVKQSESQNLILQNKANEMYERKQRVKEKLEQALRESNFYSNAEKMENVNGTTAAAKLEEGIRQVINNTYTNLGQIKEFVRDERALISKINSTQTSFTKSNEEAKNTLYAFLELNSKMNVPVTMQTLKSTYTSVPYGWSEYDIAGLIVDLLKTNDISVVYNGANIDLKHTNLVRYLTNEREFLSTTIKIKEKIDIAKIQSVCDFAKDLFETQSFNGSDGEELAKQLKSAIDEKVSELKDILIHYTNDKYPQKSLIETGIDRFKLLSSEPDTNTLFDKLLSNRDEIKEWNANYKLVKSFFGGTQKSIFDNALKIISTLRDNQDYLSMIENSQKDELKEISHQLREITSLEQPYSRIKELPILTEKANSIYNELLNANKQTTLEKINKYARYIEEEAVKYDLDTTPYKNEYKREVVDRYESAKDFGVLKALQDKAKQNYESLLQKIVADAKAKEEQQTTVTSSAETTTAHGSNETSATQPKPKTKVKEIQWVEPAKIVETKPFLETEEDVEDYIKRLSEALKSIIQKEKRIQFK